MPPRVKVAVAMTADTTWITSQGDESASLSGAGLPLPDPDALVLASGGLAVDMMYGASAAPFLDWAAGQAGASGATRDGLGMLVEQAAEAFLLWRGVRPDSAAVLADLRRRLAAP